MSETQIGGGTTVVADNAPHVLVVDDDKRRYFCNQRIEAFFRCKGMQISILFLIFVIIIVRCFMEHIAFVDCWLVKEYNYINY